ncbi:MAG: DUF1801 domain-containing protein [Armatimonadetes bacterium]|nr:DUF1801 domain-containing protein [Armatimonadota bacterium]
MTFEELIADYDPQIQELARSARDLVHSVKPDAYQEVHASWGGYLLFKPIAEGGNTVCWVSAHKKHVSLGFSQGTELPDPAGLLQGTGKHSRHLKVKKPEDLERPEVRALIQAAWDQQPDAGVVQDNLERLRQLCLSFPETRETVSHGHPTFWAGKKTFAVYGLYSPSLAFKAGLRAAELEEDPRFFPTPYMAHAGWASLRLEGDVDWDEVRELLEHGYRQVATQKLKRALDGEAKPARHCELARDRR